MEFLNIKHSFQIKGVATFTPLLIATWTNFLPHIVWAINPNKQFYIAPVIAHQDQIILGGVQGNFCNIYPEQIPHFHGDEISSTNQLLCCLNEGPQKKWGDRNTANVSVKYFKGQTLPCGSSAALVQSAQGATSVLRELHNSGDGGQADPPLTLPLLSAGWVRWPSWVPCNPDFNKKQRYSLSNMILLSGAV